MSDATQSTERNKANNFQPYPLVGAMLMAMEELNKNGFDSKIERTAGGFMISVTGISVNGKEIEVINGNMQP